MQFGRSFPRILHAIWGADPKKGPVRVSKLNVADTYHRGNLKPSQVGAFAYVIPPVPEENVIIICINLVLPMGWVDSPKFFCAFSEALTDVANTLINADLPVPAFEAISTLPAIEPPPLPAPHKASPTSTAIWMMSLLRCRGGQSNNTESLTAQSMLSNGFSPRYQGKTRTRCQSRSSWPGREIESVLRRSLCGSLIPRQEQ